MSFTQMTAKTLHIAYGYHQNVAQFHAALNANISAEVPAGSLVTVDPSTGKFALGVGATNRMPLFTFYNSNDPDIVNDGGNPATQAGAWRGVLPAGKLLAFPANAGFELVSTNYDTGASWAPNDLVTSPTSGGSEGKLTKGTLGTHTIAGIVSRGVVDNGYGKSALAFWTTVWPKYA